MLKRLHEMGVPGTYISDSAVAYHMSEVDIVIVGAEAVVESGGVINKIGTYQISIVAFAFNKPFYVAAESFKFSRIYPLGQKDLPFSNMETHPLSSQLPESTELSNPLSDYTPPKYIRLLFTDLGVLTPSAVSDELIKLYT
jgi:translation initiation factor eIF-2B subunit alpha